MYHHSGESKGKNSFNRYIKRHLIKFYNVSAKQIELNKLREEDAFLTLKRSIKIFSTLLALKH